MQAFAQEIHDLHVFFEQYFLGTLPEDSIAQFETTLAEDFVIIPASGAILSRETIIEAVRSGYNRHEQCQIWIENAVLQQQASDILVATYEEWQTTNGTTTKRTSTVIFREDASRPNGLIWLHVHESGLETIDD